MSALLLWINIPLMVLVFGLISGIPLWLVLRRPDWGSAPAETRSVPVYLRPAKVVPQPRVRKLSGVPSFGM